MQPNQGIEAYLYVTQARLPTVQVSQAALKHAYYASMGHEALREQQLRTLLPVLQHVEHALLKGAALAYTVYPDPATREMSDIDVWVPFEKWDALIERLRHQGYQVVPSPATPVTLLRTFGGELKFAPPQSNMLPIELHWPLARGEWVRITTAIDFQTIWARRQRVSILGTPVYILAFEDMLIYAAIHFAVNHRLGHFGLRGLLDVHVLAQHASLDWAQLVHDAEAWRLRTVLWVVLTLTRHFFGSPIPEEVLAHLQPGAQRRRILQALHLERAVSDPAAYHPFWRFLLLYVLVDEPSAAFRLLRHTLWPDREWAMARYEQETWRGVWVARLKHFWDLATNKERL